MGQSTTATADVTLLDRWLQLGLQALGAAREEIDALNVYPVPDRDTGTNLYLTFEAATAAVGDAPHADVAAALRALSRGALLGAQGSSGVILAQLLRAGGEQLAGYLPGRSSPEQTAEQLAQALQCAADAAYEAVAEPVEGTILTVARAAAAAAVQAAGAGAEPAGTVAAAARAARTALERTPQQLEILARAGVVDAGGRGLCVLLDAAETAVTGRRPVSQPLPLGTHAIPTPAASGSSVHLGGPSHEVMYLLDAEDAAIASLRTSLAPLGDSLVIVGGDGLWNVHVHVDDVGAAIEAGIAAGHPYRVRVVHLENQAPQHAPATGPRAERPDVGRGVVAVAAGSGLEALFVQAGAVVVGGTLGRRCSSGELLEAIRRSGAGEVVVLPNDADSIVAAEVAAQAAREESIRVAVIPTRAQVQGLAAMAVHEPARSFDDDVVHMTATAGHTRHGAVTLADRDAITMAGPCRKGDVLGVVEGDFTVVGADLGTVGCEVVDRLLGGGGEMVTLVTGDAGWPAGGPAGGAALVEQVVGHVRAVRPDVDTVVYDGGQQRYPLLIAVE